jgi:hypothetical protein
MIFAIGKILPYCERSVDGGAVWRQSACCAPGDFEEACDRRIVKGVSRSKRTESSPRQRALLNSALTPTRRKP